MLLGMLKHNSLDILARVYSNSVELHEEVVFIFYHMQTWSVNENAVWTRHAVG